MNKEKFVRILHNPQKVSTEELDALEEVVKKYPYFQTARSAIAGASKAIAKTQAPKKLTTAAIYTTNRNLLKKYVNGSFDFSIKEHIQIGEHKERLNTTKYVDEAPPPKKQGGKFKFVHKKEEDESNLGSGKFVDLTKPPEEFDYDEEVIEREDGTVEETFTKHVDKEHEEIKASKHEEAAPEEIEIKAEQEDIKEVEEDKPQKEQSVESKPQREAVKSEKVRLEIQHGPEHLSQVEDLVNDVFKNLKNYQESRDHYFDVEKKLFELKEDDELDEAVNKAIKKASNKIKSSETKKPTPKKTPKSTSRATKSKKEKTTKKEEKGTSGKSDDEDNPSGKAKKTTSKSNKAVSSHSKKKNEPSISTDKADPSPKLSNKIQQQQQIIERFIEKSPKIVPNNEAAKDLNADDLSIPSVEMRDDFATENLAQILIRQGKKEKAIEIYNKLILKNPQKKSYFASQISALK